MAPYQLGDRVFMKIPQKPGTPGKVQPRWDGPFVVISCRQGNTYRIKREDNFRHRFIRHFNQLKPVGRRLPHLTDREDEKEKTGPATKQEPREPRDGPRNDEFWDTESESDSERSAGHGEDAEVTADQPMATHVIPHRRRSERRGRPPDRYGEWTV